MTKKCLALAEKITKLEEGDVQMINGYLKILKSTLRIKETETEQIKKIFKGLKKVFEDEGF